MSPTPQIGATGWGGRKSVKDTVMPSMSTLAGNVLASDPLMNWAINESVERMVFNMGSLVRMEPAEAIEWGKNCRFTATPGYMSPAERGTFIHEVMECWLQGVAGPDVPAAHADQLQPLIDRLAEWFITNKPQLIATEEVVFNTAIGAAGRYDLVCKFGAGPLATGHTYLCDLKTKDKSTTARGYDVKPYADSVSLQLAGYRWSDKQATFPPRVQGEGKRWLYGGRVYLTNEAELEACQSTEEVWGVSSQDLRTCVALVTPAWSRTFIAETGPEVFAALAAVKQSWQWKFVDSKKAMGDAL